MKWTAERDKLLIRLSKNYQVSVICKYMKVSKGEIYNRLNVLNITPRVYKGFDKSFGPEFNKYLNRKWE